MEWRGRKHIIVMKTQIHLYSPHLSFHLWQIWWECVSRQWLLWMSRYIRCATTRCPRHNTSVMSFGHVKRQNTEWKWSLIHLITHYIRVVCLLVIWESLSIERYLKTLRFCGQKSKECSSLCLYSVCCTVHCLLITFLVISTNFNFVDVIF